MKIIAMCAVALSSIALAQEQDQSKTPGQTDQVALTQQQAEALRAILQLPEGSGVEVELRTKDGGSTHVFEYGKGTGAGGFTEGGELSESVTGSAPEVGLGDGRSARGGSVDREVKAEGFTPPALPWQNPLFWLGLVLIAGSGITAFVPLPFPRPASLPAILGISGGVFIAVAFYPALLLFGVIIGIAIIAIPYLKSAIQEKRNDEALRAVVAGIEDKNLPEVHRKEIKERIAAHAEDADRVVIRKIKMKDKLGKFE